MNVQEISLSLDGIEPFHDAIRGKGSFNTAVKVIGLLKDDGFVVRVHTTISKFNANQLLSILRFFINNKFVIDNWTWSRFWSISDVNDLVSKAQLAGIFDELITAYTEMFLDSNFYISRQGSSVPRVFIGFKEHLWFPFLVQKGLIEEATIKKIISLPNSINCTATKHVYIIDPDGTVSKCRKIANSSIGNILTQSFDTMLEGSVAQSFNNLNKNSVCGSCYYFNGCGGCAAIAEAKRKSVWAGDPDCFILHGSSSTFGEFECSEGFAF